MRGDRGPATGWILFEGPLRARAYDTVRLDGFGPGPMDAAELLVNAHARIRTWETASSMDHLFRNADGDELIDTEFAFPVEDRWCDRS